jgi:crossover junction endodeoxyribonuclease RuvC
VSRIRIIGVDPGANGGVAVIYESGRACAWPMPADSDLIELLRDLMNVEGDVKVTAFLEQVGGFIGKGQPGSAMFQFGDSFGFLRGVLQALGISTELVRPQTWQRGLAGLRGLEGAARKRALRDHASRIFPDLKPTLATADALLIARWGLLERGAR